MAQTESTGTKKRGVPSKKSINLLYQANAKDALQVLIELMTDKDTQDSVRVSAASKILDKVIPDLKSMEVKNEEGKEFIYRLSMAKELPKEDE